MSEDDGNIKTVKEVKDFKKVDKVTLDTDSWKFVSISLIDI